MAADIQERAQLAVAGAGQHNRHTADLARQHAAGRELVDMAEAKRQAQEQPLALAREMRRVAVDRRIEVGCFGRAVGMRIRRRASIELRQQTLEQIVPGRFD